MHVADLERLKMAIDTGNINYYHGDMSQAFVDVVEELLEIKTEQEENEEYKVLFEQAQKEAEEISTDLEELEAALMNYEDGSVYEEVRQQLLEIRKKLADI